MKYVVLALVLILVLGLSTFGVQNPTPVNVRFLQFQSGFVPLSVIVLHSTLSGMFLVALASVPSRMHRRLETRRLRHQLVTADEHIAGLKDRLPAQVMRAWKRCSVWCVGRRSGAVVGGELA